MTKRLNVPTFGASIINLWLSFDSVYVLALVSIKDKGQDCTELRAYDIEAGMSDPAWTVEYTGKYLKMQTIEQNKEGTMYAVPYNDHGKFFISLISGKE
jgi:hypothetical protein